MEFVIRASRRVKSINCTGKRKVRLTALDKLAFSVSCASSSYACETSHRLDDKTLKTNREWVIKNTVM